MSKTFTIDDLRERGFRGFVRVKKPKEELVPSSARGVYVVVRKTSDAPHFLRKSDAPPYKKMDPTVPVERLEAEWVDGAQVLYVGGSNHLRHRVGLLGRFDLKLNRWGGRFLWQLDGWRDLLVAWKVADDHFAVERELIDEFVDAYGKLPYANLVRGNGRRKG